MSLIQLLYYPDIRLRKIAKPVTTINNYIINIIDKMFEIMYKESGIGLAATQINIQKQIIVIDISKNKNNRMIFINPKFLNKKGKIESIEGCLSIPNQTGLVKRSKIIKIKALDKNGNKFKLKASNLLSICIQHEIDHLNGKLFVDYLSQLKQQRIYQKMKKFKKMKIRILKKLK